MQQRQEKEMYRIIYNLKSIIVHPSSPKYNAYDSKSMNRLGIVGAASENLLFMQRRILKNQHKEK